MSVHLIAGLPAVLVVARPVDGDPGALVLVNPTAPTGRVLEVAGAVLAAHEREELAGVLAE